VAFWVALSEVKGVSKPHLYCLALPLLSAVVVFAQQNPIPVPSPTPDSAPAAQEGRINLDVVVTDKSGKPVSGLGLNDFTLLDNGQPGKILSFHAVGGRPQTDPPVQVILLIDEVNNWSYRVADECQQIEKFLSQNGGHLAQPVSILVLTGNGLKLQSPASLDGNALAAEVGQVEDKLRNHRPGHDDLVYPGDSFRFSLQALMSIADDEAKKPARKLLIWDGPGWSVFDSRGPYFSSKPELQSYFKMIVQLSTRLREARITVYNVMLRAGPVNYRYQEFLKGVKTAGKANSADLGLHVLAVQSGGRDLGTNGDLPGQIDHCIQDASAFYTLSFDPPRAEYADEYHDLKLLVDNPKLIVRSNTGYYNQPEATLSPARVQPALASKPADDNAAFNPDASRVPARPVTVAQLEQDLKEVHGQPDAEAARQLSDLMLTERLSSVQLLAWKAGLPGAKAQQALVALADASAFLAPPAAEIPANAPPDLAAQRRMIAQAVDYLGRIVPKLPDFFATRQVAYYEETPPKSRKAEAATPVGGPLHLVDSSSATVLYRNGHEVVGASKGKKLYAAERLIIKGTFGPILSVVIGDTASRGMTWNRWEKGAAGPLAVFHFTVPKERSHYRVAYNGLSSADQEDPLHPYSGYHGEITIDPETGTILRLVQEADLEPSSPMVRADIMMEYGPVVIGGQTYICPVRSVSISRGPSVSKRIWDGGESLGPPMTRLNDMAFVQYHIFRSEVKMLSADDAAAEGK
jgi:VWFA-related protein